MLHLVATDFRQSLNQTVVCSRSDAANPNHFHKTEETVLTTEETVFTNEETVLTNEETVLTNEETVLTNEETVLTNEETLLTNEETEFRCLLWQRIPHFFQLMLSC